MIRRLMVGFGIVGVTASAALAASAIQGRMTSDGITGRPAVTPHGWGEERIYLCPIDTNATGGSCKTLPNPPGWYSIQGTFFGGNYNLFTLGWDGAPAFTVSPMFIPGGTQTLDPVELRTAAHYSVAYDQSWYEWAQAPWVWGTSFYQTFVATSPYITRLATKLAGKSGDHYSMTLNFAVCEVNAGPPSTWPQISATRSSYLAGTEDPIMWIHWVAYRSDEMHLTPGQTYALRLWDAPGSQATSFALVARPDSGDGYANGQLYVGDTPSPGWDAYAYISGGSPRTVVNHAPINSFELLSFAGWSTCYGQTFQATGTSLAGAAVVYTDGNPAPPSIKIDFQAYDAVGGARIGPTRSTNGVSDFYQARAAAAWAEGEVPLVPGQMYYLEWTTPPAGCNTWQMNEFVPGTAYVNHVAQPFDLMMAIAEYRPLDPEIALSVSELIKSAEQGTPAADTFTVRNGGAGTIDYTVSSDQSWMSVEPSTGSSAGEADTITVTYTTTVDLGTYTGTITVSAPGVANSPQTIPVTFTVRAHPGDMDLDGDVDMADFGLFQACLSGSGVVQDNPNCQAAKLTNDDYVDAADVAIFLKCLSGEGIPATPGCGG